MAVGKHIPLRKCVACGEFIVKKDAVRVTREKNGTISVDANGKNQGRGAYLCKNMKCFENAQKGRKLERSLKCQVSADIYDMVKEFIADE